MSRRFVILKHDHPFLHWDLLLENGPVAATWRLLRPPECGKPIESERLPDHRLQYLDYEGPVGGDRGSVQRLHAGTWQGEVLPLKFTIELIDCGFATRASYSPDGLDAGHWVFHR